MLLSTFWPAVEDVDEKVRAMFRILILLMLKATPHLLRATNVKKMSQSICLFLNILSCRFEKALCEHDKMKFIGM